MNSAEEHAQMEAAGFQWDPAHRLSGTYARWTHTKKGTTALRQPFMTDEQWDEHRAQKILESHPDWGTPNWCSTCTPAGLGYCRCEIACNE